MNTLTINLSDYCRNGNYNLVSRTQGGVVRTDSNIDHHIKQGDSVKIIIPREIFTLGQSFLEELLENPIQKLGRLKFSQRVEFISEGRYSVKLDLEDVIRRVLDEEYV